MRKRVDTPAISLPRAIEAGKRSHEYVLRLYVTGATARSARAIVNIKRVCERHLQGRYTLEVIDVCQQPALAKGEQILAAPTLVKHLPLPLRRFIGDMSRTEKILLGLDLQPAPTESNDENENGESAKPPPRF